MKQFMYTLIASLCLGATILQAQTPFFTEEFNGGIPMDWNAIEAIGDGTPSANWNWTDQGPQGTFAVAPLSSNSADNGWMIFDSDLNCSGEQDAWLVAPQFDFSERESVFLRFETYYRSFNDRPTLEVSTDSITWESIEIFPGISANDFGGEGENPQVVDINLTDLVAGESQVWLAFRFFSDASIQNGGDLAGCGYSWQIDDVQLFENDLRAQNDLRITTTYAIAPNFATPAGQVEEFGFFADLVNVGIDEQTGTTLSVEIVDQVSGETVYTVDEEIGTFPTNTAIQDRVFGGFTPPAEPNSLFVATYTLSSDAEDGTPMDNTRSFEFLVSDTSFFKVLNGTIPTGPAADNSYSWGNSYYVPNDGQFARYATFAVNNPGELAGKDVSILLYEWEGDLDDDFVANPDEYNNAPIAFNSYTFTGDEMGAITVPVSVDEVGVALEGGNYYFVVVQYDADDGTNMEMIASDEHDYLGTYLRTDSLGAPRYAGMLDVGNTGEFSIIGFGFDVVPVMRLHVGDSPDLTTSAITVLSPENTVEVFPNPVQEKLTASVKLVNRQDIVVQIFSVSGQLLLQQEYNDFQAGNLSVQVKDWPAGAYFMKVKAEEGVRIKRFVVQK